jgi:gamma-tubulin complex component 2
VPLPPTASSSRQPLGERREPDRISRHGKAPARVLDLEPPIEEVAGLELRDEDMEMEDETRKLDGVPLEVQEAWICEDLIVVLQVSLLV